MQPSNRSPEDVELDVPRSRPGSRRNSASSRRSSIRDVKPPTPAPHSLSSTPKHGARTHPLDFTLTGKQITRRSDRANSLPGSYLCRPANEPARPKRIFESQKTRPVVTKRHETSVEDDMSLDYSQISDCEDPSLKYGRFRALATSTPRPRLCQNTRSVSLQNQMHVQRTERKNRLVESKKSQVSTTSRGRDLSCDNTLTSSYYSRCETELGYSSVSPEYSGLSSADHSPGAGAPTDTSPRTQDLQLSSCCVSTWQDSSETDDTKVEECRDRSGEWESFWAKYNGSMSRVSLQEYYDQCPTPYRTGTLDPADLDTSPEFHVRSPSKVKELDNIIRSEGLHLTPRETQSMIKCAHVLSNVLSNAIERRSRQSSQSELRNEIKIDSECQIKKKSLKLDLRETVAPSRANENGWGVTAATQTDISLPNTKSAPRIFENILRQLSKTTIADSAATDKKSTEKVDVATAEREVGKTDEEVDVNVSGNNANGLV
ncbi:uncharacterized protein LOC114243979 [Bombyx mandarina]|uniref:Uncharacterized protein LOC114243979 n=1 Tax=Bombyx mandarina TaxID=7092 RepID=A0A6J2JQA5_BOMMA|nr:uncharacterized protein LOC114243979 [Bombyx mandarina]